MPKELRLSDQWKIDLYQNYIAGSSKKPMDIMLNSDSFSEREKEFIEAVKNGFVASFKLLGNENGLKVYNFVNEKEYIAYPVKQDALEAGEIKYFASMMINFEGNR